MKTYHSSFTDIALLFAALFSFLFVNSVNAQCGFNTDRRFLSFSANEGNTQTEEVALANTLNTMMTLTFTTEASTDGGLTWASGSGWFTVDKAQSPLNGDSVSVNVTFHAIGAS